MKEDLNGDYHAQRQSDPSSGTLPPVGSKAPDFHLTKNDLGDASLADFAGKVRILNIVPSLDTSVCALSAKKFDKEIGKLGGAVVLNISRDLPFAQSRFCKAEGVEAVIPLSELRSRESGRPTAPKSRTDPWPVSLSGPSWS